MKTLKNIGLLFSLLGSFAACASVPPILWGSPSKILSAGVDYNGVASFLVGTANPSVSAQSAPQGSVYCRTGGSGGTCYVKQDAGSSTNWTALSGGAAVLTDDQKIAALSPDFDLSAEDLSGADASEVTAWTDRSGHGYNLVKQAGTGPGLYNNVTIMGGKKALLFPQSTQRTLYNTAWPVTGAGAFTFTIVFSTPSLVSGAHGAFCLGGSTTGGEVLQGGMSSNAPTSGQGLVLTDRQSNLYDMKGLPLDEAHMHVLSIRHEAGGTTEAWIDGVRRNSFQWTANIITVNGFSIGGSAVEAAYHYGYIARAIEFRSALTYANMVVLHGALISIYGG